MLHSIIHLMIFHLVYAYDNLALNKTACQLHNYENNINKWPASLAVDGNRDHYVDNNSCAISAEKQNTAMWRVDLGKVLTIGRIDIFYRNDAPEKWDTTSRPRFAGFFLYVSNTTTTEKSHLCFHNLSYSLPPIMTIDCVVHGQYVIMYNERLRNITYPNYYSEFAFIDLCELEVYGCNKSNVFGKNCDKTCPSNCQEHRCDIVNGTCLGCVDGFKGKYCNYSCDKYTFGPQCTEKCGSCLNGETCNNVNGSCTRGCAVGWQGIKCDTECESGTYGNDCMKNCSRHCKTSYVCDNKTGECYGGCKLGWDGIHCDEKCGGRMFGQNCSSKCGDCLGYEQCHHINGTCFNRCDKGFQGEMCTDACDETFYGEDCRENCSSNCVNRTCDAKTGTCTQYYEYESDRTENMAALVGGLLAAVILLVLLLTAVLYLRRFREKKETTDREQLHDLTDSKATKRASADNRIFKTYTCDNMSSTKTRGQSENEDIDDDDDDDDDDDGDDDVVQEILYANSNVILDKVTDIPISQLQSFIGERLKNGDEIFKEEYASIPFGETANCDVGKQEDNMKKNRFRTTFPYDHSRVILDTDEAFTDDYINANYIKGTEINRQYIASQGPKPNTIQDFWRMVWQENIIQIVMLTNLVESNKVKCSQYWPEKDQDLEINPYVIKTTNEKTYAFYIIRSITVIHTKLKRQRTIQQFHYTAWPDHGTPDPLHLVVFQNHVMRNANDSLNAPTVVHCSAGVGRTGTYIALDTLYRLGLTNGKVNVAEFVKSMRLDRMNMVQTHEQYISIFLSLCEAFKAPVKAVKVSDFVAHSEEFSKDLPANQNVVRQEFQELQKIKPTYGEENFKLARQSAGDIGEYSILPLDKYCLHLMTSIPKRGNFINAIEVPSFTRSKFFIVTLYPTQYTVVDLFRLLNDHDSSMVVIMNPAKDIELSNMWLPQLSHSTTADIFSIKCQSINDSQDGVTTRLLKVNNTKQTDQTISVTVIEPTVNINGNDNKCVTSLRRFVSFILKSAPPGPVTLMSRDGANLCGMFCAIFNVLQQINLDAEVDIFTAVRQLQIRRPEFCSSVNEYHQIYDTVKDYILYNSDHVYYN